MVSPTPFSPFLQAQRILIEMQTVGSLAKGLPIAIEDISRAVLTNSTVSAIQFRLADVDNKSVVGLFRRITAEDPAKGDIADIIISKRLDDGWRRFVACKELCQVVLSDYENTRTSEPHEVAAYMFGLIDQSPWKSFSPALQADQFATICAIEVLCPFPLREPIFRHVEEGAIAVTEAARIFGIPEQIAVMVFSPTYHENARQTLTAERSSDFRLDPRSRSLSSDLQIMFQRNVEEALRENDELAIPRGRGE
jgi:hypothetical protein